MAKSTTAKIQIENVGQPGKTYSADAAKYDAMKKAMLKVLPETSPGLTVAEVQDRVVAHLPEEPVSRRRDVGLVDEGRATRPRGERHRQADEDLAAAAAQELTAAGHECSALARTVRTLDCDSLG